MYSVENISAKNRYLDFFEFRLTVHKFNTVKKIYSKNTRCLANVCDFARSWHNYRVPTRFLDLNFYPENLQSLLDYSLNSKNPSAFHFCSADAVVQANKSTELKRIFLNSTLICDSRYLELYLKFRRRKISQVRGTDFLKRFLSSEQFDPTENFFIVANNQIAEKLETLIKESKKKGSSKVNIYVPGALNEWYSENENISRYLQNVEVKYAWIGIGSPKQFYLSDYLTKKFSIQTFSIGAAFDFALGTKAEARKFLQRIGFEWIFRLISEPKRLWKRYLFGNARFLLLVLKDTFKINV